MSVLWTVPEHATRYAPYVEELRDFFAVVRLHSGAPEDLVALAGRLDASDSFREDLSSMVRVVLLREGGTVSRADLLEIVTIAIGGAEIDQAPLGMQQAVIQQPVQRILAFLNDVLRRPWNQAPGEERLASAGLDATAPESPAALESPSTAKTMPALAPKDATTPSPEAALVSRRGEVSDSTHTEEHVAPAESKPAGALDETPLPAPAFVRPESVYSRFTDLDSGTETPLTPTLAIAAPDPEPPAAPALSLWLLPEVSSDPAPAIASETLPPQQPLPASAPIYASKVVPWPNPILELPVPPISEAQHNLALEQFPNPAMNILFPPAIPAAMPPAAEAHPHLDTPPVPPSTLDPEPPSPSIFPAMHHPKILRLPKITIPQIPAALRIHAPQIRIVLMAGASATLIVAVLMLAAHRSADALLQAASRPLATPARRPAADNPPPATPAAALVIPAATTASVVPATAAPIPTTSPSSPSIAHPQRAARRLHDDYIAPPWSTPIPPELAARASTPRAPSPSAPADSGPASAASAGSDLPGQPTAADTASSSPVSPSTRHLSVSSGEMAVLSAPPPGYPVLAKIAHVQGQVVVEAVVDPTGTVSAAHVLSGHHLLRGAALDAVLHRRYRPYRVDGHPVEVSTTITLSFPSHP